MFSLVIWRSAAVSAADWRDASTSSLIRRAPEDALTCTAASCTLQARTRHVWLHEHSPKALSLYQDTSSQSEIHNSIGPRSVLLYEENW